MKKSEELADPNSCLNRAADDEIIFVLREHDITFPGTVRDWINRRVRSGKNLPMDPEIVEAQVTAATVEARRR